MSKRYWRTLLLAVVVLAAACGSSDEDIGGSGTTEAGTEYTTLDLTGDLLALIPVPADAATAVLLADDGGYSLQQIADAVAIGTFTTDGTIPGVEPAREPVGAITLTRVEDGPVIRQALRSGEEEEITDDDIREAFGVIADVAAIRSEAAPEESLFAEFEQEFGEAAGPFVAHVVVAGIAQGYGADQITAVLVGSVAYFDVEGEEGATDAKDAVLDLLDHPEGPTAEEFTRDFVSGLHCIADGRYDDCPPLEPANEPQALHAPGDDGRAGDAEGTGGALSNGDLPLGFSGPGVLVHSFTDAAGETAVCETDTDLDLVLAVDGTATFTQGTGSRIHITPDGHECQEVDGNAWTGTFDLDRGTVDVPPPSTAEGFSWTFEASFDATTASGFVDHGTVDVTQDSQRIEFTLDRSG